MNYYECIICHTPIDEIDASEHTAWHLENTGTPSTNTISVYWQNDTQKIMANDLRNYLRSNSISVSKLIEEAQDIHPYPRFDIFVTPSNIESIEKYIKKNTTCSAVVFANDLEDEIDLSLPYYFINTPVDLTL